MNKIEERKSDILKIIRDLDITKAMEENAISKYESLAEYLDQNVIYEKTEIYPQGSFALGVVVKPQGQYQEEIEYDLDLICEVQKQKQLTTPSNLKGLIKKGIRKSGIYGPKLEEFDECLTIHYAECNGVNFSIDVVPAIPESIEEINKLKDRSNIALELLESSICIPKVNTQTRTSEWVISNPRGFIKWFQSINNPYLKITERIEAPYGLILHSAQAKVDKVPEYPIRSAIQRVIQILKLHRNQYYAVLKEADLKPISALLTYLVAKTASNRATPTADVFLLLKEVLEELVRCNPYGGNTRLLSSRYSREPLLVYTNGEWRVENPANQNDNLVDKWNDNPRIPMLFFQWVMVCQRDLIEGIDVESDIDFGITIRNAFGTRILPKSFSEKYSLIKPTFNKLEKKPKPYSE